MTIAEHPETEPQVALSVTVKAINDTPGSEGFVPSALVFGDFPRVTTQSEASDKRPTLADRSAVAQTAREEIVADHSKGTH